MSTGQEYNQLMRRLDQLDSRIVHLDDRLTSSMSKTQKQVNDLHHVIVGNGDESAHITRLALLEGKVDRLTKMAVVLFFALGLLALVNAIVIAALVI